MRNNTTVKATHIFMVMAFFLYGICLPINAATYQVTRTNDPAPDGCDDFDCSLREAVLAANANPGMDVINLNQTEYHLTRQGQDDTAINGDLDVSDDLTVVGIFSSNVPLVISTIDANNLQDRIFEVSNGVILNLENLLLTNANALSEDGGAIRVFEAELNLLNTHFILNRANKGGALYAENSTLHIVSSDFIINVASHIGGAIAAFGSQMTLESSDVNENAASFGGGIAAIGFEDIGLQPSHYYSNSKIRYNHGEVIGGGLYIDAGSASQEGLAQNLIMEHIDVIDNEAESGAGIFHDSGDLTINTSTIRDNSALLPHPTGTALGAGIYFGGVNGQPSKLRIYDSLIHDNESKSTLTTGKAAGIYIKNHVAEITNTTISHNIADSNAAIQIDAGILELTHNTFVLNESVNGFDLNFTPGSITTLQNNIIKDKCLISGFAEVNSMGGNIESPGDTCRFGGDDLLGVNRRDLINLNLLDNGGPTMTHAITSYDSDAIGFAVPLNDIDKDQRLMPRDNQPDSGAYEVQPGELNVIFKDGFEQ